MINFLKKYWQLLLGLFLGIAAVLYIKRPASSGSTQDALIEEKEKELDKIEEKMDNLEKEGVEPMTVDETLEYWKNQK